jgi:hypothetical protein
MIMILKTREEAIMDAWKQIQQYCKEKYAGKLGGDGTWIEYKYDHFFSLMPNGDAYLSGGTGCMSYRHYHPIKQNKDNESIIAHTELAVQNWPYIKRKLEERIDSVYNFKI